MSAFTTRILRATLLDSETYEEVEADRTANLQALGVVMLAGVSAGVGSMDNNGAGGILPIAAAALAGWWIWAYLTYFIGTRFLAGPNTEADHGELLRTIGFSSAPGILLLLAVFPPLAEYVWPLAMIWMLVAMIVAVRQALDYEGPGATGRAVLVCAVGFPVYASIVTAALLLLGPWPI
jgi:hypothetical protein